VAIVIPQWAGRVDDSRGAAMAEASVSGFEVGHSHLHLDIFWPSSGGYMIGKEVQQPHSWPK
jgi:hypothetical protein